MEALSTFEDAVGAVVSRAGGVQVAPITTGGRRYSDYYIGVERETLLPLLNEVLEPFRYEYKLAFTPDPEKKGYWEEIYPTVDDWRVIRDLAVLEALAGHGDDPDVERSVTHCPLGLLRGGGNGASLWRMGHIGRFPNGGDLRDV